MKFYTISICLNKPEKNIAGQPASRLVGIKLRIDIPVCLADLFINIRHHSFLLDLSLSIAG